MKSFLLMFCVLAGIGLVKVRSTPATVPSVENLQLSVTQKGLDYANKMFREGLINEIEGLRTSSTKKSAFWTTLELITPEVKNVVLQSSSIRFDGGLVKVKVILQRVNVAGQYKFSHWFSSGNGDFTSKMSGVLIEVDLALGRTNDGKALIANRRCRTSIPADTMTNKFNGASSFFLNIGVSLLNGYVKTEVENKICTAVVDAIQTKSSSYSNNYTKAFSIKQAPCASLEYLIPKQPIMKTFFVDYMLEGKVSSSCSPPISTTTGQANTASRVIPSKDYMMTLVLSDQYLNSLLNVYYQQGLMLVSMDVAKATEKAHVVIKPTSPPITTTGVNGSLISFNATADVNITTPNGQMIRNEDCEIQGEISFEVENQGYRKSLSGKLSNLEAVFLNAGSKVKQFDDDIGSEKVNLALNKTLNQMIPLPLVGNITLVNHQITYSQAQVILASDIHMY